MSNLLPSDMSITELCIDNSTIILAQKIAMHNLTIAIQNKKCVAVFAMQILCWKSNADRDKSAVIRTNIWTIRNAWCTSVNTKYYTNASFFNFLKY